MSKKKQQEEIVEDAAPITASTQGKKKTTGRKPAKDAPKTVTKMQIVTNDQNEPLEDFQTGAALATRQSEAPQQEIQASAPSIPPTVNTQGNGIKISHVKLVKDLFLKVKYDQSTQDGMISNDLNSEAPVHDDLKDALGELNEHCAVLANQYNKDGNLDTGCISCMGFTVRTGNIYGVKLIAQRKLADGKTINILPPFTKLGEGSNYEMADELEKIVDKVISEATLYLGGKHKKNPQGSIEFGDMPAHHTTTVFPAKEIDPALEPYVEVDI